MKQGFWIKLKSNITLVVLLFAFGQNLMAIHCESDTLILDGEMIYIEKREVEVDLDSLSKEKRNDVIAPKDQTHFWLGINAGASLMRIGQTTSSDSLVTLAEFLGKDNAFTLQPLLNVEGGLMFNNSIGLFGAVGVQRITCSVPGINESELAPSDQISQFENRNGQLWQYYTFPVGPGFETDTVQVSLTNNKRTGLLLTTQLGAKFFLSKATFEDKGDWKVYGSIALQWSKTIGDQYGALEGKKAVLLNENGGYRLIGDDTFKSEKSIFSSLVGLGVMRQFNKTFYGQMGLTTFFPPSWLTAEADYRIRFSTTTFSVGLVKYF
ncbi:MAG: hypothetical protein RLZZ77_1025 [Bacteroidota bacterium]